MEQGILEGKRSSDAENNTDLIAVSLLLNKAQIRMETLTN